MRLQSKIPDPRKSVENMTQDIAEIKQLAIFRFLKLFY